jgi:hypothetical protein
MDDLLGANEGGQRGPSSQFPTCKHCGGFTRSMSLLDPREGKRFQLVRCTNCEKLDWREEG